MNLHTLVFTIVTFKMLFVVAATLMSASNLVLQQVSQSSLGEYTDQRNCLADTLINISSSSAICEPRKMLVKLSMPDDSEVYDIMPTMVEVSRCGGVCQEGNTHHKCVPRIGARRKKSVEVLFHKMNGETGQTSYTCSTTHVEEHTDCICGCDLENANCNDLQAYNIYFCKCECTNQESRKACLQDRRKFWDPNNCRCFCKLEEYRECSTGFVYDSIETCRCVRATSRAGTDLSTVQVTNLAGVGILIPIIIILLVSLILNVVFCCNCLRRRLTSVSVDSPTEETMPMRVGP